MEVDKSRQRNFTKFGLNMNPVVSFASGLFILIFALYSLFRLEQVNVLFNNLNDYIVTNFDWIFIFSGNIFILVCIGLAVSKLGEVKIGGVNAEPEFSNFAWYSMLMSAGMGIGLMFWAVGEPLTHYIEKPPIFGGTDSAVTALASTFLHWGLHPWAIYAVMALGLSYFAYNRKLPLSLRSVFYPFLGDRIYGKIGDLIDTFAVLATMFGLATSLGLGTMQINSGLDFILGVSESVNLQVGIIAVVTLLAVFSVLAGINKGVRFLSEMNIKLAAGFMLLIFLLGPSLYILRLFIMATGTYLGNLAEYASFLSFGGEGAQWQGAWTVFYLGWWISWSPFVGMFIARVSRGRTIREFMLGVLIFPSIISFFWLSVFGGTAIKLDGLFNGALFATVQDNYPVALFEMVELLQIPLLAEVGRIVLFVIITALVMSYFITSSDSGSLVVDKLTSGGIIGTPKHQRAFWAILEGLLAATLLIIGGEMALNALQTAVITAGLPLAVIMLVMSFSLIKEISGTHEKQSKIKRKRKLKFLLCELEEDEAIEFQQTNDEQNNFDGGFNA